MSAIQARMSKLYADDLPNFVPTTKGSTREAKWSFMAHAAGTPSPITSRRRPGSPLSAGATKRHRNRSHPRLETDPRPSECDTAICCGAWVFLITRSVVWVAMPSESCTYRLFAHGTESDPCKSPSVANPRGYKSGCVPCTSRRRSTELLSPQLSLLFAHHRCIVHWCC